MGANPWSGLPHLWLSVGLPGFERESTYQGYSLERMPSVPIDLDDDLRWLRTNGMARPGRGLDELDELVRPLSPATVIDLAAQANLTLPPSFARFMTSPDLQSMVRSCTACYLDPGQRVVETTGSIPGHLVHFLSDSQSCAHWYVHILQNGHSAILESPDLYCYQIENSDWMENPACRLERINLTEVDIHFCAPSFSEFLFRFWIENEIWYALKVERRPLSALENAYLNNQG
jgi:hypothetical protein